MFLAVFPRTRNAGDLRLPSRSGFEIRRAQQSMQSSCAYCGGFARPPGPIRARLSTALRNPTVLPNRAWLTQMRLSSRQCSKLATPASPRLPFATLRYASRMLSHEQSCSNRDHQPRGLALSSLFLLVNLTVPSVVRRTSQPPLAEPRSAGDWRTRPPAVRTKPRGSIDHSIGRTSRRWCGQPETGRPPAIPA